MAIKRPRMITKEEKDYIEQGRALDRLQHNPDFKVYQELLKAQIQYRLNTLNSEQCLNIEKWVAAEAVKGALMGLRLAFSLAEVTVTEAKRVASENDVEFDEEPITASGETPTETE